MSNRFFTLKYRLTARGKIANFWLIFCLLSQFWVIITPLVVASPSLGVDSPAASPDTSGTTLLKLTDLPTGFEVAPPLLQQIIQQAIEQTKTDLKKVNIDLEETVIFVDIGAAEIVACVVMKLANHQARDTFDHQLQRQDAQEVFLLGFQQVLRFLGEAKVAAPKPLESLQGLGESALGYRLNASIANFPTQIFADSLAFRRQETGILLIVGSLANLPKRVDIKELAFQLDQRLQSSSYDPQLNVFMTQKRHGD